MPLFGSLLHRLDDHLRSARRVRLRDRTIAIVNQDRREALAACTGWRPPVPPAPPPSTLRREGSP
jgi:hypothetical protein